MRELGLDARVTVRALVVGAVACALALAAHLAHGATPTAPSVLLGLTIGTLLALPFAFGRPSPIRAISAVAVGQLSLHVWFAWTAFPSGSPMPGMTIEQHHRMSTALPINASSALDLLPSPTMLAGHIAAAAVCALTLLHCDRLIAAVAHVLGRLIALPSLAVVPVLAAPARVVPVPRPLHTAGVTRQPCVRRGPPAPACV